jgi:hypothetical protein
MVEIVKLNVGGHPYHISRTLLERYPLSTITRTVVTAEEERGTHFGSGSDSDSEIFICGDGTAFRFILNYLRHGRVFLPLTETKASFMNELSHYGLVGNPDEVYVVGHELQPQTTQVKGGTKAPCGGTKSPCTWQVKGATPARVPCTCSGPCIDSCECRNSQQSCLKGCACASKDSASSGRCGRSREIEHGGPCDCLGPCRGNCACRMAHRSCQRGCGCHGRCS